MTVILNGPNWSQWIESAIQRYTWASTSLPSHPRVVAKVLQGTFMPQESQEANAWRYSSLEIRSSLQMIKFISRCIPAHLGLFQGGRAYGSQGDEQTILGRGCNQNLEFRPDPNPSLRWPMLAYSDLCHLFRWCRSKYLHSVQLSIIWGNGNYFSLPQVEPQPAYSITD